MSPAFIFRTGTEKRVQELGTCWSCGCTPDQQCTGGCEPVPRKYIKTLGLCSACIQRKEAYLSFPSSKKHNERGNSLSDAQIDELGGWGCKICERSESYGVEVDTVGRPISREMELWRDPSDRRIFIGMVCSIKNENRVTIGGCADPLGRVARGTLAGSARRLLQFQHYRDNRLDLAAFLHIQPTTRDRAEAHRRKRDNGVNITAVEVAALRGAAGHLCQVCRRPGNKDSPYYRGPLVIDHDHETGRWRGLLCYGCNGGMTFLDYGEPRDRERYFNNAMRFFASPVSARAEPNYDTLREGNKARAAIRRTHS
ncbi:endonuclease domain-containing protein [Nonomuraea sp. NPDC049141]|uniref:endonuclease domain-containing protein n=1 Tax=Nonomuraea sp. NPDC049141 TaxID=3155500 RepID=UPI00340920A9